ncbi:MAG: hypothetical protein IK114_09400 [Fibrobacter sp.]|nr:hypothetical protein [Fibrobacter sp.]
MEKAFKSVGQKYGFVSAGDVFRQKLAAADREVAAAQRKMAEAHQEAEDKLVQNKADTATVLRKKGLSDAMIAEIQSEVEALQQERLSK